ncbi:MAG TPA: hypothetical protein ENK64_03460, partial [Flavobacteriales bacterium]|nr:hypothetical protein [Flavobacteriales bacterium]
MTKELISIHKLCEHYQIPDSFFEELQQFELIPFETTTDEPMIDASVLPEVEKFM